MHSEASIALVGLPGSGKSTIGRHLARSRGLEFIDSDHVIEQRIGCSIRDYFEHAGEPAFRDIESEVIAGLARRPGIVLATGGGAVLREQNRQALREGTRVVYLRASPDDLARRLARDTTRPVLQVADPRQKLRELFALRDPLYRECAHFSIDTARKSVPMLVGLVGMQLDLAAESTAARAARMSSGAAGEAPSSDTTGASSDPN